jgi:hypothetical protein
MQNMRVLARVTAAGDRHSAGIGCGATPHSALDWRFPIAHERPLACIAISCRWSAHAGG